MKPRPYDLTDPKEIERLYYELAGYMKVSLEDGTDRSGRQYALDALRELVKGDPVRAMEEKIEAEVDRRITVLKLGEICEAVSTIKRNRARLESDVVEDVKTCLNQHGIPFKTEVVLPGVTGRGARIDFFVEKYGIGIEIKKGKPNTGAVARQLERYASSDIVKGLILITERGLRYHIETAHDKPVRYVSLAFNWGLTV